MEWAWENNRVAIKELQQFQVFFSHWNESRDVKEDYMLVAINLYRNIRLN